MRAQARGQAGFTRHSELPHTSRQLGQRVVQRYRAEPNNRGPNHVERGYSADKAATLCGFPYLVCFWRILLFDAVNEGGNRKWPQLWGGGYADMERNSGTKL